MAARRQYHWDEERAKINRLELEKRATKKWKQLELLDKLREEAGKANPLFDPSLEEYHRLRAEGTDEEIKHLAEACIEASAQEARVALQTRLSSTVIHPSLGKIKPSRIKEGRSPIDSQTYRLLREDIRRKGILVPLVVSDSGEIIDGHVRFRIAKELGLKKIPCFQVNLSAMPEHQRYRLILEIRFSHNLSRRHAPAKEVRRMRRLWKMFFEEHTQPGRPSKEETRLKYEIMVRGVPAMSEVDRHLARLYGLRGKE
jgi:hypothetical protein